MSGTGQKMKEENDDLGFHHDMFKSIPLCNWSTRPIKSQGLFKYFWQDLWKSYKSHNHDDFESFAGYFSEIIYFYLCMQEKPQLQLMVEIDCSGNLCDCSKS